MLNIKRDPETQKLHFEGFLVDLMEKLASDLSINYTMKFSKSKGKFNGGNWTGLIGKLIKHVRKMSVGHARQGLVSKMSSFYMTVPPDKLTMRPTSV